MLGKRGNIVQRYKALADLKKQGRSYPLNISFQGDVLDSILNSLSETYNQGAVEASLTKTESGFQITEGQTGRVLDIAKSKEAILNYLHRVVTSLIHLQLRPQYRIVERRRYLADSASQTVHDLPILRRGGSAHEQKSDLRK